LTHSSAGHPAPFVASDGEAVPLESIGVPLGAFADARYRDHETAIQKGSLLLLYTDGITEVRQDRAFFGEERLVEALGRMRQQPLDTIPSSLLDEALAFSGGVLRDDTALLAVNYQGKTRGKRPGVREQAQPLPLQR